MKRKPRPGEVNCRCGAYRFPHRMMGGACDGSYLVDQTFADQQYGDCRDCHFREIREDDGYEVVCQVLCGQEPTIRCPALESHVSFHGVKLYGVNKPPEKKRATRR